MSDNTLLATQVREEPDLDVLEDPYPSFPQPPGLLHELASAIAPSLAYAHKVLHLLTCAGLSISGAVRLATDPWLQPRFYACAIGPAGQTKTAVDKEVRSALFPASAMIGDEETFPTTPLPGNIAVEFSINSGPALVQAFEENPRILYAPDELSSAFEKARQTSASPNSLLGEFLRLYESNEIGRRVVERRKKKKDERASVLKLNNAHFAFFSSATTKSFDRVWQGTGGAASGLQSRFVLAYADQKMPAFQVLADKSCVERLVTQFAQALREAPQQLTMTNDAQQLIVEWVGLFELCAELPARALDMAKRAALVASVLEREQAISQEVMAWALAFAQYQINLKALLLPQDADGNIQAFENRILAFFDRYGQATLRQARRAIHPERHPGGLAAYERALRALLNTETLRRASGTKGQYERD